MSKYSNESSIDLLIEHFNRVSISRILNAIEFPKSSYYYHKKATLSKTADKLDNIIKKITLD